MLEAFTTIGGKLGQFDELKKGTEECTNGRD
jgi:hypothetical protein